LAVIEHVAVAETLTVIVSYAPALIGEVIETRRTLAARSPNLLGFDVSDARLNE